MIQKKKCTMQDIANKLGVSKNAVSLALNDKVGVSDTTKKQIIKTAHELGYYKKGERITNENNNILVLIPDYIQNDAFFYNKIYWSVENHGNRLGYTVTLVSVSGEMEKALKIPAIYYDIKCAGFITIGVLRESYIDYLLKFNLPIVSIDNSYSSGNINSILTTNLKSSFLLTEYLIGKNHKKIGFVGSIDATESIYKRFCGYCKALRKHKIPYHEKYCILKPSPLSKLFNNPDEIINELRKFDEMPTAFVCGGDRIAISLIQALNTIGYKVPDDISVVGFDDIEAATMITPPLTTANVKRVEMGVQAVEMLDKLIGGSQLRYNISLFAGIVERQTVQNN